MVHQVTHPLVQHKLSLLRSKQTKPTQFRRLMQELAMLMTYEITQDLATELQPIETPTASTEGLLLTGAKPVLVAILRAGNALVEGCLQAIPEARVGHIGLHHEISLPEPCDYYYKMPQRMRVRDVIVLDPILATGQTAVSAIAALKARSMPKSVQFMCLIASPEGIAELKAAHTDVQITTAAIDPGLDERHFVVPGFGNASDRLYGV